MNIGIKMTVKILLIVMLSTLCYSGGHNEMLEGVKIFKNCNMIPLQLSTEEYAYEM